MRLKVILACLATIGCMALVGAFILLPTNDYMKMSFSEKLKQGYTPHVLINGDSIGGAVQDGEWCTMLKDLIKEDWSCSVRIDNISKPGNSSFAGIVSLGMLDNTQKSLSDLVILCYGQNDQSDASFAVNYEALIRSTIAANPNAEIIAILESSQKGYTDKIKTIMGLCDYYDIPYVDTIEAFNSSGYSYEELSDDGIHPNALGKKIYANAIYDVINNRLLEKQHILDFKGERPKKKKPQNNESDKYNNFHYVSVDTMTVQNNTVYTTITECSIIGFDMMFVDGQHKIKMTVPGEDKEYDVGYSWNYGFEQQHIYPVLIGKFEKGEIRVSFENPDMIGRLLGLIYFE